MDTSFFTPLPKSSDQNKTEEDRGFVNMHDPYKKGGILATKILEVFGTPIKKLPEGYKCKKLSDKVLGIVGEKGCDDDWAEVILYYPILIFMFCLVLLLLIIGLCTCFCYNRHQAIKEEKKCLRFILIILVVILLVLISWGLLSSLNSFLYTQRVVNANRRDPKNTTTKNEKMAQLRHVVETNYGELEQYYQKSTNTLIDEKVAELHKEIDPLVKKASDCASRNDKALKVIDDVSGDFYSTCVEVMEWIDVMRDLQRDMTFRLLQFKGGANLMKQLDFAHFYYKFLPIDPLQDIETNTGNLHFLITTLKTNLPNVSDTPKNLEQIFRGVISPELKQAQSALKERGVQFRSVFSEDPEHDYKERNCKSLLNSKYVPEKYVLFPWVAYGLIMLVMLIWVCVLIGLICSLILRRPSLNIFFTIAVCMISLFSVVILALLVWYFFYGAVMYANLQEKCSSASQKEANNRSICFPGKSLFESLQSHPSTDFDKPTYVIESAALTNNYEKKMETLIKNLKIPSPEFLESLSAVDIPSYCTSLKHSVNVDFLAHVVHDMEEFINETEENQWGHRELALCQLNEIHSTRVDEFETSGLAQREKKMLESCEELQKNYGGDIVKFAKDCVETLKKLETALINSKNEMQATSGRLEEQYNREATAYIEYLTKLIEHDVGLCRKNKRAGSTDKQFALFFNHSYTYGVNGIWTGMFFILCLLPFLMWVLCYFHRYPVYGENKLRRTYRGSPTHRHPQRLYDQHLLQQEDMSRYRRPICKHMAGHGMQSQDDIYDDTKHAVKRVGMLPYDPSRSKDCGCSRSTKPMRRRYALKKDDIFENSDQRYIPGSRIRRTHFSHMPQYHNSHMPNEFHFSSYRTSRPCHRSTAMYSRHSSEEIFTRQPYSRDSPTQLTRHSPPTYYPPSPFHPSGHSSRRSPYMQQNYVSAPVSPKLGINNQSLYLAQGSFSPARYSEYSSNKHFPSYKMQDNIFRTTTQYRRSNSITRSTGGSYRDCNGAYPHGSNSLQKHCQKIKGFKTHQKDFKSTNKHKNSHFIASITPVSVNDTVEEAWETPVTDIADSLPENLPENLAVKLPEKLSEKLSEKLLENLPENVPENLPENLTCADITPVAEIEPQATSTDCAQPSNMQRFLITVKMLCNFKTPPKQ